MKKIDEYIAIPSVVNCEKPFVDYLENDFRHLGCEISRYGRLLGVSKGEGEYVLSAHIDRHGLIAEGGGLFEYAAGARKEKNYETWQQQLPEFKKIAERFAGESVYAYDADTGKILGEGTVGDIHLCDIRQNMTVSIAGMDDIPARTPVAYTHKTHQNEDDLFSGQIDNVVSAALIHTLYTYGYGGHALFTPEEESGNSWRYLDRFLTHFNLQEKKLLVLDTSPFQDESHIGSGGVVLRMRDENSAFNPDLTQKVINTCTELSVSYVLKDQYILEENKRRVEQGEEILTLGRTELGRLYAETGQPFIATTMQFPTFNYHKNNETTSHASLENVARVILHLT